MSKPLQRIFTSWIPLAFGITAICASIYLGIQQNYRQSANDPQIQMAEDFSPSNFDASKKIDISKSLAPFIIYYDDKGNLVASQAVLNNNIPNLPNGVLDYVKASGEDRITWQPQSGVRIATVIASFTSSKTNGFVLAGRNIREVEARENMLTLQIGAGWVAATFGSLILIGISEFLGLAKRGR